MLILYSYELYKILGDFKQTFKDMKSIMLDLKKLLQNALIIKKIDKCTEKMKLSLNKLHNINLLG